MRNLNDEKIDTARILWIDDEPDLEGMINLKMRQQIRSGLYDFAFSQNGLDGLSILRDDPEYDLVLLDINMPEMGGLTMLSKMQEHKIDIKTIMVTAYGDMENIRTAMVNGAHDYIVKPINFKEFEITLEKSVNIARELKKSRLLEEKARKDLIRTHERLQRAYDKEKELSSIRSNFFTLISREFRAPLTAIQTSTEIIQSAIKKEEPEKVEKFINTIQNSIKSMTGTLDDVLTFGNLKFDEITPHHKPMDIIDAFRSILYEVKTIDKGMHKFEMNHAGNLSYIKADGHILFMIISNLLGNAVKYSPPDTTITLNVFRNGNNYEIEVIDRGIGIPEADLPYIFNPFRRGSNIKNIQGTGLGLTIVRQCVTAMKGNVEVESTPGELTKFFVSLPVDIKE